MLRHVITESGRLRDDRGFEVRDHRMLAADPAQCFIHPETGALHEGTHRVPLPPIAFLAGRRGAWWDATSTVGLFQDEAGNVPVAVDGDEVRMIADKGPLGAHMTLADGPPPVFRAGPPAHVEFAGTEVMQSAAVLPAMDASAMIAFEVEAGRTVYILGRFTPGDFMLAANQGNDTPPTSGPSAVLLDGAPVAFATRGEAYDGIGTGVPRVLDIDQLAAGQSAAVAFPFTAPSFSGKLFSYLVHETATAPSPKSVREWIAARSGVVLAT